MRPLWKPTRLCAALYRRDTGDSYETYLTKLAQESGIETPSREDLARIDRKRPKKGSNDDWQHPQDPDARITKMKDGRTHLAHKAEQAVDLETGAVVGITVQGANQGDTTTIKKTLIEAAEQIRGCAAGNRRASGSSGRQGIPQHATGRRPGATGDPKLHL